MTVRSSNYSRCSLLLLGVVILFFIAFAEKIEAAKSVPYKLSGRVTDYTGKGIADILVKFSNGSASMKTAQDGTWSKSGLVGRVTVTPSDDRWVFVPKDRTATAGGTFLVFKGYPKPYSVSGRVTDYSDNGLAGVRISFSTNQGSTVTDASGNWSYEGLRGSPSVVPSKPGYVFAPSSRTASSTAGKITFTGSPKIFRLSGRVVDGSGAGVEGVALNFDSGFGTVYTDRDGLWSKESISGDVTIIAVKSGWSFEPSGWKATHGSETVDFLATQLSVSQTDTVRTDVNPEQWPRVRLTPQKSSLSSQLLPAKDSRIQTLFSTPDIDTHPGSVDLLKRPSDIDRLGIISLTAPKLKRISLPAPGNLEIRTLTYDSVRAPSPPITGYPTINYNDTSLGTGLSILYGSGMLKSAISFEQSLARETWISTGASLSLVRLHYLGIAGTLGIFTHTPASTYGPFGELSVDLGPDVTHGSGSLELAAGYRYSFKMRNESGPYFRAGFKNCLTGGLIMVFLEGIASASAK